MISARQLLGPCVAHESLGLLGDPGFVGMLGGGREEHAAGADMQKDDDKQIAKAFGCQHSFAEEIALPERGGMDLQELIPGSHAALRPRIEAMCLQDVFDRVARDASECPSFFSSPRMRV